MIYNLSQKPQLPHEVFVCIKTGKYSINDHIHFYNDDIKDKNHFLFIFKWWGVLHSSSPPNNPHSKQQSLPVFKYKCSHTQGMEEPERQQKWKHEEKGIGTLRDNFYLRRTDLFEKAKWIIFLILYFCCDIIKMHATYQHWLFCIHNLKLKLISCHKDLTHLLMVPSQKSVLLQEKQLFIRTLEKNNRGELTGGHWTLFSSVQKTTVFILFSGCWTGALLFHVWHV